jgi:hypothetical protein
MRTLLWEDGGKGCGEGERVYGFQSVKIDRIYARVILKLIKSRTITSHYFALSFVLHTDKMSSSDDTTSFSHDIPVSDHLKSRVLYEATLQDLIRAQNYAVDQLLRERNDLLDERYVDLVLY